MPLHSDYICNKCEKIFEYAKYYGEENFPENPECPNCKSMDTRRKYEFAKIIPQHMKSVNG